MCGSAWPLKPSRNEQDPFPVGSPSILETSGKSFFFQTHLCKQSRGDRAQLTAKASISPSSDGEDLLSNLFPPSLSFTLSLWFAVLLVKDSV